MKFSISFHVPPDILLAMIVSVVALGTLALA
jgi:hypothetical protein